MIWRNIFIQCESHELVFDEEKNTSNNEDGNGDDGQEKNNTAHPSEKDDSKDNEKHESTSDFSPDTGFWCLIFSCNEYPYEWEKWSEDSDFFLIRKSGLLERKTFFGTFFEVFSDFFPVIRLIGSKKENNYQDAHVEDEKGIPEREPKNAPGKEWFYEKSYTEEDDGNDQNEAWFFCMIPDKRMLKRCSFFRKEHERSEKKISYHGVDTSFFAIHKWNYLW